MRSRRQIGGNSNGSFLKKAINIKAGQTLDSFYYQFLEDDTIECNSDKEDVLRVYGKEGLAYKALRETGGFNFSTLLHYQRRGRLVQYKAG